jgi:hypothetical protein
LVTLAVVSGFGDSDPEDAYEVTDPPGVRFRVLLLWVASVALEASRGDHDPVRVHARIQGARWAAGVLDGGALTTRQRRRVHALQEWLDDLLAEAED